MNFSEAVAISASSLWTHKLRSILTLIGVAAVIAVVSLINGANQYVATRVFRLGADVFGLSKQPSLTTGWPSRNANALPTTTTKRSGNSANDL